jgi:acetyl-CoA carboxylase biotin carboxylase subunit
MIKKILIVNRGEIAVRIIRACKELEIIACAGYSDADSGSLHVRMADEAYLIGGAEPVKSYLNIPNIINTALENNIDAIHPGYGFLAESPEFIEEVEKNGIIFIGPTSSVVKLMGNKIEARRFIKSIGVPFVPGAIEPAGSPEEIIEIADRIGYPVILKAAAGGGGKGMRVVHGKEDIISSLERAKSEAMKAFNDDKIYVEKYLENPKHIEVQVLSDTHGNHIHLFERECSVQRRNQKIIEEAPSSSVDDELRRNITAAAVKIVKEAKYTNAGTIEFLLDRDNKFYFLEMNTRLQVEHPVTEAITGIDIVKEQVKIAEGNKLCITQDEIKINGYAIECRINSEDPYADFTPSTGRINYYSVPGGKDIRIDSGIDSNSTITLNYDSLLTKLIVHSSSRIEAINRMKIALKEFRISGVISNLPVHLWVLESNDFLMGNHSINFLEGNYHNSICDETKDEEFHKAAAAAIAVLLRNAKTRLIPKRLFYGKNNRWSGNE